MRTERENFISGFENQKKYSGIGGKVNTTRSERTPIHRENENLKGIINTENFYELKRDTSPVGAGLTPMKLNDDSLWDYNMQ